MKSSSARETPMMRQFLAIKADYPDAVLCYRMGDFYELFLDDAVLAAPILDITLTTRDKDKVDPVPMCGFPVHSAEPYFKRLAEAGHRVAICEQVENPADTGGKRLVRREVVEVVTPGLVGDPSGLEAGSEVVVVAVAAGGSGQPWGLAVLDASTGDFRATSVAGAAADRAPELLLDELRRIAPREFIATRETRTRIDAFQRRYLASTVMTEVSESSFEPDRAPVVPDGFDASSRSPETRAAAALIHYLGVNQPFALSHAPRLRAYRLSDTMVLDESTRTHLELFQNNEDRGRSGTLIECLDCSSTPLGSRRIAHWLRYPLLLPDEIRRRQEGVAYLAERDRVRARLREALRKVKDLERILTKAIRPSASPRDLGMLRASLAALPGVIESMAERAEAGMLPDSGKAPVPPVLELPDPQPDLEVLLQDALIDAPPVVARGSRGALTTGYIREGFRPELDLLRESAAKGREWIASLEASERARSGISTLKVKFHPVHGYSLEVSKSQLDKVPDDYERKQTLANVERFTTPELSEVQGKVMGANERAAALEREVLENVRLAVVERVAEVRRTAETVSHLDALASLADVARRQNWIRPEVCEDESIAIGAGRHPVVEAMLSRVGSEGFVPNDSQLDTGDAQILLLTGPNMSGKSTYLRQVALIVLMTQMGSFVPAQSARIGVVDRIFTRVGASDRLARGESTFMVEMRETAEILRAATRKSLLILDEIGRGTSTFDGLSIAWAVLEYLHDTPALSARTLFATHYHELTELSEIKSRVRNGHFEAREFNDEVVFLRRLVAGGASRSYGIQVARLAGLPDPVIVRAREILQNLEAAEIDPHGVPRLARGSRVTKPAEAQGQLAFSLGNPEPRPPEEEEVLAAVRDLDLNATSPIDALLLLQKLRDRLRGAGGPA